MRRLTQQAARLRPAAQAATRQAEVLFREALEAAPDDRLLHAQRAALRAAAGNASGAAESARRVVELLPPQR